jgi:hypothetical protein
MTVKDRSAEFRALARMGIHLPGYSGYFSDLAHDAQVALVTTTSAGIPAYLANYVDPKFIEILTAPNKAAKIIGEAKKGDWTSQTLMFPVVEYTGEVSTYGDYAENGSAGVNQTFPQRQPYHYQTITQWGEKQLEVAGLAKIDYAARVNQASANVLNKFQNDTYFYGVAGLQCYGLLNDPALSAAIAPGNKVFNANASGPWITNGAVTATAAEVYSDIQSLYSQLVSQTNNLIDAEASMVLAMSPAASVALLSTNQYNVNVTDQLKKNFPNLRIETAPQYATSGGNLVQLIVESIEGQEVAECVYTEKMRAHAIIRGHSNFSQKKSQGTVGSVIYRPMGVAQLLGV